MKSFGSSLPAELVSRYGPLMRERSRTHQECGCFTEGVTFTPKGLMVGTCLCECPDHRCAETEDELRGEYTFCRTCRDTRYVRIPGLATTDPRFGKAQPCPDCFGPGSIERVQYLKVQSGITREQFDEFRLDLLPVLHHARQGAEAWYGGGRWRRPFLVLYGEPGTGKTHAAVGLALRFIQDDQPVSFSVVGELIEQLRATNRRATREDADAGRDEILRQPRGAALTILDDLAAHRLTEYAYEQLFLLVTHRYDRRMATIITTNTRPERIDRSDRLWSRIFGDRFAQLVETSGPDRRRET